MAVRKHSKHVSIDGSPSIKLMQEQSSQLPYSDGKKLFLEIAIREGNREERKEGRKEGGREEGSKEGRKGGRKVAKKGGRKVAKKGGRKVAKKEGREEGRSPPYSLWQKQFNKKQNSTFAHFQRISNREA